MNKVPKTILNKCIENCRNFWKTPHPDCQKYLDALTTYSEVLAEITNLSAFSWQDIIGGILANDGINKDATNEQIYEVLKILGWEVVDE